MCWLRFSAVILLLLSLLPASSFANSKGEAFHSFQSVPPAITGQKELTINEDASHTLQLTDLEVSDPDNAFPNDFTMTISTGANYTLNGNTITPDANYHGTLTVRVVVNDGTSDSNPFDVQITVESVNDLPIIVAQSYLQMNEDSQLALALTDLTVTDADDVYPQDFTLSITDGDNYSVSGNTITPSQNFSGTLVVPVRVNDGTDFSNSFDVSINIISSNDAPIINGHNPIQTAENKSVTLSLSDLDVTDPDNIFPGDFSLQLYPGANYNLNGLTVIPDENFHGNLSVPVTVFDGDATSNTFHVVVSVSSVNNAPTITGQQPLTTIEEQTLQINISDLTIDDPDNSSSDFTLEVQDGDDYSVSGNSITPDANFNGTLKVPVTVNDGSETSPVFNLSVIVTGVNDAPVITGQFGLNTSEDTSLTIGLQHLQVDDPDNAYPDDFSLSVFLGNNYSVDGTTITPSADFTGSLFIDVSVNDGQASSDNFTIEVTVGGSNDVPVITGQNSLSTFEETPVELTLDHLLVTDPDNDYPDGFSIFVAAGDNYTVDGTTVTPVENFTGTLTIPVMVNDGGASSNPFNFQLSVIGVNDAPSIVGQNPLTVIEDNSLSIALTDLQVTDTDNSYPSGFTMTLQNGTDYTVNGNTITPATNFNGTLTVPVVVNDGSSESALFNLSVTVTPVNDVPVITGQTPLATGEETPITLELPNFIVSDPDNNYPSEFTFSISPGANYTVNGNVITPAADFAGTLSVGLTVSDGQSTSAVFNAQIAVNGNNDAPVISGQVPIEINEDQPYSILLSHLTVTDSDNTYPQGFSLQVLEGTNYTVASNTITPALNFSGALTIPVTVNDGASVSNVFQTLVTVKPVNDAPVIAGQNILTTYRNKSITVSMSDLQVNDPDNSYPGEFTMSLQNGPNHSVVGNVVSPRNNFVGTLQVPVTVNDGLANSVAYSLNIEVTLPPNVAPVITGQVSLSTFEDQPIILQLSHLVVSDPDNAFPNDFTLTVLSGQNYSLNGNTITPAKDFNGKLSVPVTVHDKEAASPIFNVQIDVVPVSNAPLITSQQFLRMNEESTITLSFNHITVSDADDNYPNGFTMSAATGTNYAIEGLTVRPAKDFNGYITVPIVVNDGVNNSNNYQLMILVEPLNDAPVITDSQPSELIYRRGNGSLRIFESLDFTDVDDDSLTIAEVSIAMPGYEAGKDSLAFENTTSIRTAFDKQTGELVLFGNSSLEEYETLIIGITYDYNGEVFPETSRSISVSVSDGKIQSNVIQKTIIFVNGGLTLDVPSGFTPNGDGSNDTWSLQPPDSNVDFSEAVVRVFDKRGVKVFESRGLSNEWDGRFNGSLLPADTYFYTIDLNSNQGRNHYRGVITLLR